MTFSILTKRQREVLDVVLRYITENDYGPSVRDIADELGVSSPATVHAHLAALQKLGFLSTDGRARQWLPTEAAMGFGRALALPLLGLITAGQPIEAIEDRETIAVPAQFVVDGLNTFVLRVRGDSMIEEGILSGDYVVVERNPSPRDGDVVVALLDNEFATLKKFFREPKRIRLEPANSSMRPIYVKDCIVQGVVKAVMRKYTA
jgi:repressor LexA